MALSEQDQLKVRRQLFHDFSLYSRHALKVRTKAGTVEPFALNAVQQRFHAEVEDQRRRTGRVRKIILKGRQQGFTTYVGGRIYGRNSQRKARKALVVAHKADSTRTIFDMYQRYHTLCPTTLKPSTKYSSRKELFFDTLDTAIIVATAGGDGIARGETITDAHLSELAFWQASTAEENLNGLLQSIPNANDTEVYIESTANGFNLFYDQCQAAIKGESDFEFFFAAWFETPEYRRPVPADFGERTIEEEDLVAKYGLDDEQLEWRRKKIGTSGIQQFQQEYPCCAEEAFIASGRPVFDPQQLHDLLEATTGPIGSMDIVQTEAGYVLEDLTGGRLSVYRKRDESETYCIGADVGMGVRDGDWSVAHVLDSDKRQVAKWRGQVDPHFFADILKTLGTYYNNALVCPERNNHGLLTSVRLWRDLGYANTYIEHKEGQIEDNETMNIGHYTDVKTRPLIIDSLRAAMRENDISVYDENTLHEMKTFVVDDRGKMTAEQGCHDDEVMGLAIANFAHPGRFHPITVSDEYYADNVY